MTRKYFGTDGVRGEVGVYPITPEFAMKLGWAAGQVFQKLGTKKVIIGKDTRISGYLLETALEAGLIAAGIDIRLLGPMPTPGVAYLTKTFRAEAGIVISASHNPYQDNGIKFFSADGLKLPDEVELEIESYLDKPMTCVSSEKLGKAVRINDAAGRYIEFCKSHFPSSLTLSGLKVVVDCAHGATYHIAPAVFRELGAEVIVIGNQPDGLNINKDCGATHVQALQEKVLAEGADLGMAFDGDGDRLMMVNNDGQVLDGDDVVFILAKFAQQQGKLQGGVVGTLMSNYGLELALTELGIPFLRAKVGDRYVMELLLENNWQIGGENSGHILNLAHTSTGDGIVSAIQVLAAMQQTNQSLTELLSGMTKFPQLLVNVRYAPGADPLSAEPVQQAVRDAEQLLAGKGRVLLRKSGTEPLIRVMVEARDEQQVQLCAQNIADQVRLFA